MTTSNKATREPFSDLLKICDSNLGNEGAHRFRKTDGKPSGAKLQLLPKVKSLRITSSTGTEIDLPSIPMPVDDVIRRLIQ